MRNHVVIYQIHWDNRPQQVTWEVAELHQTVLTSASKRPFAWPHANKQFVIWHVIYTKLLKYFRNILPCKLHFPAEKQSTLQ